MRNPQFESHRRKTTMHVDTKKSNKNNLNSEKSSSYLRMLEA